MSEEHAVITPLEAPGRKRAGRAKPKPSISKSARLTALLSRPRGATIGQLEQRLGWQAHTIRAAISRLRTRGAEVTLDRSGRTPVYRLVSDA